MNKFDARRKIGYGLYDTNELNIYFNDLTPEAQHKVLNFYGLKSPSEGNFDLDISPIAVLMNDTN
jgi:hypothetical protein